MMAAAVAASQLSSPTNAHQSLYSPNNNDQSAIYRDYAAAVYAASVSSSSTMTNNTNTNVSNHSRNLQTNLPAPPPAHHHQASNNLHHNQHHHHSVNNSLSTVSGSSFVNNSNNYQPNSSYHHHSSHGHHGILASNPLPAHIQPASHSQIHHGNASGVTGSIQFAAPSAAATNPAAFVTYPLQSADASSSSAKAIASQYSNLYHFFAE